MSKQVEEQVVSMQFDNKNFEKNVSTSMSTLDKLKEKLKFQGVEQGFNNISKNAKNVDLSPMSSSIDALKVKFSTLDVVAMTALNNIVNTAINASKRIVNALTLEPVVTGFSEYETKINSVQTILANTANKGTQLSDVVAVLDELNTYADKTIYNFAEMTRNIGTFTAAGIGLEDSASAIQGIANLAATSGSNSQQAATAMYQLSQALAAGKVQLMDWNSVVNAGMGGEKFQEALKQTAREHGIAVDAMIKKNGSFRDSLQEGWITADVLNETLKKFTVEGATEYANAMMASGKWTQAQADVLIKEAQMMEDAATKVKTLTQLWDTLKESVQSGWAQTWEILFGNFDEAKELFTAISDSLGGFINAQSQARNELLQGWKDLGGRLELLEALKNVVTAITAVLKPIGQAFREVFPPKTAEELFNLTRGFREFTEKLIISEETSKNLKSIFKTLFSVMSFGVDIVQLLAKTAGYLLSVFSSLLGGVLDVTAGITNFTNKVTTSISTSNTFAEIIRALGDVIGNGLNGIIKMGESFVDKLFNAITRAFETGDATTIVKTINGAIFSSILLSIRKWISGLTDEFGGFDELTEKLGEIADNVSDILGTVRGALEAWQNNLKANTLLKIAGAVGILAAAILTLSTIDKSKLNDSLGALTVLFGELLVAMSLFGKIGAAGLAESFSAVTLMIGMSSSLYILAGALVKLSSIDSEKIAQSVYAMGGLIAELVAATKIVSSGSGIAMSGSVNMIFMAGAIKILASACADIAKLNWEQLTRGLTGTGILLTEIGIFVNKTKLNPNIFVVSIGIATFSGAIKILASACADIAKLDWEGIGKSLSAIGGLFIELSLLTKMMGNSKRLISGAIAITVVSLMVKSLTEVFKDLSKYSWEDIGKSLIAIAGSLASVTLAVRGLPADNLLLVSGALPAVTESLVILAEAMTKFAKISWGDTIKGIFSAATTMTILVKSLKAMKGVGSSAPVLLIASGAILAIAGALSILGTIGAVGVVTGLVGLVGVFTTLSIAIKVMKPLLPYMISLSTSLTVLGASLVALGVGLSAIGVGTVTMVTSFVTAMVTLGSLSWETITKGLVSLAGIFTIIGVAAKLLKPAIPSILSLSISMLSMALSFTAVSGAIALLTASMATLVTIGEDGARTVVTALREILVGLTEILPEIIPNFGDTLIALINTVVEVFRQTIPNIVDSILLTFVETFRSLTQYAPQIVDFIITFLIDAINVVATRVPELTEAFFNLVGAIFTSLSKAFENVDTESLMSGIKVITILTGLTFALNTIKSMIPGAMAGLVGVGVLTAELSLILAALGALNQIPGLDWLISEGGNFVAGIGTAIGKFVGGIVGGFASGVIKSLPTIATDLSTFMNNIKPFIEGAKTIDANVAGGITSLASAILMLTAADVLNSITSWLTGGNSIEEFGEQLVPFGNNLKAYSDVVSGVDPSVISASANAAKALSELANGLPNSGGLVAWFTGSNNIDDWGEMLAPFGENLKKYSDSISGIDGNAITTSANAAKSLAELSNNLPNSGGLAAWFSGSNNIDDWGEQLVSFGKSIREYSDSVIGLNPVIVTTSANAAKSLAELSNNLPNSGGFVSLFTGDNSISKWGSQLPEFGKNLKAYSDSIEGINSTSVSSSATAAQALAKLAQALPNTGGIIEFFAGGKDLSSFSEQLPEFGKSLKKYSDSVVGISENVESIHTSAIAVAALAKLSEHLPSVGGILDFFNGEKSLKTFGEQLPEFGSSLKSYSESVSGISENVESINASATAVESLAKLSESLPSIGGFIEFFAGKKDLKTFGEQLPEFATALKNYATNLGEMKPEVVTSSATAAKTLVSLANNLYSSGGAISWFTGNKTTLSEFGEELPKFGKSIKKYVSNLGEIKPEVITASANAAKALVKLANTIGNDGGFVEWFADNSSTLSEFGEILPEFGTYLNSYATNVTGVSAEVVTNSVNAINSLITAFKNMSGIDMQAVNTFVNSTRAIGDLNLDSIISNFAGSEAQLISIGTSIDHFISEGIKGGKQNIINAIIEVLNSAKDGTAQKEGEFSSTGEKLASKLSDGFKGGKKTVISGVKEILNNMRSTINGYYNSFKDSGEYLADGFAKGISNNAHKAEARARAMANGASEAVRKALGIASPSKVMAKLGNFTGMGFVQKLAKYINIAKNIGYSIGDNAVYGLNDGISRVNTLDFSGQSNISSTLDTRDFNKTLDDLTDTFRLKLSADVIANVKSIDDMMSQADQIDAILDKYTSKIDTLLREIIDEIMSEDDDKVYIIEVPLVAEGREIARASAKYMKKEIEKIDKRDDRKGGNK